MPRAEQLVISARRAQAVNALTETTFSEPTAAIFAEASGSFIATLWDDSADVTFTMVQGVLYPLAVRQIDATSTIAVVALFNVNAT